MIKNMPTTAVLILLSLIASSTAFPLCRDGACETRLQYEDTISNSTEIIPIEETQIDRAFDILSNAFIADYDVSSNELMIGNMTDNMTANEQINFHGNWTIDKNNGSVALDEPDQDTTLYKSYFESIYVYLLVLLLGIGSGLTAISVILSSPNKSHPVLPEYLPPNNAPSVEDEDTSDYDDYSDEEELPVFRGRSIFDFILVPRL